ASALWSLLVDTKIKIAIAAAALAGVAAVVWTVETRTESPAAQAALVRAQDPPLDDTPSIGLVSSTPTSERETLPKEPAPAVTPGLPPGHPIVGGIARGRVIDVEGTPVTGIPLVLV